MRKTTIMLLAAVAVVGCGILLASPLGRLGIAVVYASLFERSAPPIAAGVVTADPTDRAGREHGSSLRFTRLLQSRFPVGTPASALGDALLAQGFDYPREEPACVGHEGRSVPLGNQMSLDCPVRDWKHTPEYDWRDGLCHDYMDVHWSENASGRLTLVTGRFRDACM